VRDEGAPANLPAMIALGAIDVAAAATVPQLRAWIENRPFWAQAILALVVGDLGVSASHRLSHAVPWLWRCHAGHHSAEEMDWLVGLHHAAEREAYDKNFASLVASWDVLFGTVHLPGSRLPQRYGIEDRVPAGWIERLFHPFRRATERNAENSEHAELSRSLNS
jgi:sterol desaturase/sphingolipid hydroxylase (fatty acid hydroxylase superfamily)